jgi:hypothetical protein
MLGTICAPTPEMKLIRNSPSFPLAASLALRIAWSNLELRQIRSFLSIAETLHFGRTAELIHISQPALSLQIRALEEEVAVRLFERNRRKTTLTVTNAEHQNPANRLEHNVSLFAINYSKAAFTFALFAAFGLRYLMVEAMSLCPM